MHRDRPGLDDKGEQDDGGAERDLGIVPRPTRAARLTVPAAACNNAIPTRKTEEVTRPTTRKSRPTPSRRQVPLIASSARDGSSMTSTKTKRLKTSPVRKAP